MKIIKRILLVIGAIIALLLIVAIFVPKQYTVSVTETINKPKSEVYDYLKMLKNQDQYSEWVKADSNLKPEISGTDGTVGAIQKWNSKMDEVGEGEQEIIAMTADRIEVDLRFKRPFKGHARAANIFKEVNASQTAVTAEFYADDSYPMNLMGYFIGRSMIREVEAKNLKNIKAILEKQ